MTARDYILRKYDDIPATHVLREICLPPSEMHQVGGYLFVPPELAAELGPPDAVVHFGEIKFNAWRMDGEMPTNPACEACGWRPPLDPAGVKTVGHLCTAPACAQWCGMELNAWAGPPPYPEVFSRDGSILRYCTAACRDAGHPLHPGKR